MPQPKITSERVFQSLPRMELVVIGLLSLLVLQLFRSTTCRWMPALWIETILMLALPPLTLWCVYLRSSNNNRFHALLPGGAILYAGLALLIQCLLRQSGYGDATEVVSMIVLQYAAWYLIIFSSLMPSYKKVGFITCCALVLFTCFLGTNLPVFLASFFFAVCAMWHLLSNYWARVNDKAIDGESRMLPVNGAAIALTLLAVVGMVSAIWAVVPESLTENLQGFSPFSGGEQGRQDIYAQSGVGDGDLLRAGENATTAGPVETDQFIEDDKPSIYDLNVEKFDAATEIVKKKKTRAVSINAVAKHLHKVIKSEQAGKSFRTARKARLDQQRLDLEDRISKALFYVEGSVPARFSIDCFNHFDGWDWSKVDLPKEDLPRVKIGLDEKSGSPWYRTGFPRQSYLATSREHKVKILRLETTSLPAPSLVRAWHIDQVNVSGLFGFDAQGTIYMDGKFIPSHTVIDMFSSVPNFYVLANKFDCQMGSPDSSGSPLLQIPDNPTQSRIKELVNNWTQGYSQGWSQVEAIVERLRSDFAYEPTWVASDQHADSVQSFLDQRGGPVYQFASAATQMLRAAGYKTRLNRGFLVQRRDYSRASGQSVVTSDNLHMWPEVCLDGRHWIPVEPTPGFPIPYSHLTWWQWSKIQAAHCMLLVRQNPVASLLVMLAIGCLVRFRWESMAGLSWLAWSFVFQLFPSRRLTATRKLIDRRFWAAGSPRPQFTGISEWFSKPDPEAARTFCNFWQIENFSSSQKSSLQPEKVTLACRQIVGGLSLRRIRSFIKSEFSQ